MDKVINIKFEEGQSTQRDKISLKQWDFGQILQVEGLELPDGNIEVHFSLTEYDGKAPVYMGTVKDNVVTVEIPEFILQKENVYMPTYEAYAWLYVTDEESGKTIRKIVFTIESRAEPTTGVPEDNKDKFLEEVRKIMSDTKEIAQSVRDDADAGKFNSDGSIDEEQLLKFAIKQTTEKAEFLNITDSTDYRVLDFGMNGKTEQVQYSGKNLFDENKLSNGEFVEFNGVRCYKYTDNANNFKYQDNFKENTQYTLTVQFFRDVGITNKVNIVIHYTDGTSTTYVFDVSTKSTRTSTSGKTIDHITGTDGYSISAYLDLSVTQIELGTAATSYEPYVGGQPSPSPEYPQEIVNAGKTKNLLDVSKEEQLSNNLYYYRNEHMLFRANQPYTFKIHNIPSDVSITGIYINVDNVTEKVAYSTNVITFTFAEDTYGYIRVVFSGGTDMSLVNDRHCQLELGDTATDYEPYGTYKIDCTMVNKNLWDAEYASDKNNWKASTWYPCIPVKVPKGATISVSYQQELTAGLGLYVCISTTGSEDGTSGMWLYHNTSTKNIVRNRAITAINDYIYIHVASIPYENKLELFMQYIGNDLQIEVADAPTGFTEHQTNSFTLTSDRPLTKWDKLVKRDGVWGWSVFGYKCVFDGTESWKTYGANVALYTLFDDALPNKHTGLIGSFCNIATETGIASTTDVNNTFKTYYDGTKWVVFHVGKSVADWKAYLAEQFANGTPIYIMYQTAEEQSFIPLPDEEQELLNNLETYYGATNVYNDQGCQMWLMYVADTKLYVDNQILEMKKAII